jgi:hypothetical protein
VPDDHPSRTSITLIGRLRQDPRDQTAWGQFVERYRPGILGWCRRWGPQESDFAYDPSRSFRGWL